MRLVFDNSLSRSVLRIENVTLKGTQSLALTLDCN